MELPQTYTEKFRPATVQKSEPRSEWEEQLDLFLAQINPGRIKDGYEPYTHAHIAKKLSACGVHDAAAAYVVYQRCLGFDSFSKGFSYLTKV